MGLSFHDEPSLVESVGSLRFGAADPNPIPDPESISLLGSLRTEPHDPNAISLEEEVGSLRFEAADPNAMPGTGSISLDGSLSTGPYDPNAIPEMTSIEERRDDDIGWGDDIQIVYIWTYKFDRQPTSASKYIDTHS